MDYPVRHTHTCTHPERQNRDRQTVSELDQIRYRLAVLDCEFTNFGVKLFICG